MSHLDLDAERAARREESEPFTVTIGGDEYTINGPAPLKVGLLLRRADFEGAVAALFGDDSEKVIDAGLTMTEFNQVVGAVSDHFLGAQEPGQGNRRASSSKKS